MTALPAEVARAPLPRRAVFRAALAPVLRTIAAGALAAARPTGGQERPKVPRIGLLWFASRGDPTLARWSAVFRQRLAELGYVESTTIVIDERYAEGNATRLPELVRELVAKPVDVIVASAVAASMAARQATDTIPIVMVHAGNPIGAGLIASLARPGGNVTGTSNLSLGAKHVELIRELVPRMARLAALVNPTNAAAARYVSEVADAARGLNLGVVITEVVRVEEFPKAFAVIRNANPDGLLVMVEPLIGGHRARVVAFAAGSRLPTIYDNANMVKDGGLVSYGPLYVEHYVTAAGYVDKILKGAKPADLPVEQPTRFELVLNLKAARMLGLTVPPSVLVRATEIIE